MSTVVVKRFLRNGAEFSIRRRSDGGFQLWEDNVYAGLGYGYEDEPMSGIFADCEMAESELLRMWPDLAAES